ncbi:MAG TPA: response regulator [Spirochaetia bacterium]|nr:response regulator [Spirochaetia bacterium]
MYRLVIVDDEVEIRKGLTRYFPWWELDFEVAAALENGLEALNFIRNNEVDAILTDIRMPVMSGIELARAIRKEKPGLRIVFLSAFKDFSYAQTAVELGVKRYVLKPTDHRELRSTFLEVKKELDLTVTPKKGATYGEAPIERVSRGNTILCRIDEYLLQQLPLATLEGAARAVHLNPQYVSRLFKSLTGRRFGQYLLDLKMRKAAELLEDFSYYTYQVSELVGYSNPKNFSRSFKRHFGVSPRDYQQRGGHEEVGGKARVGSD